jgi:hypothetical protein
LIVRGTRVAEDERADCLRPEHLALWGYFLANSSALDDFGCARWSIEHLLVKLFPRRSPPPRRFVRTFMRKVEAAGLVESYSVRGTTFAQVLGWHGVTPSKRRYHRAPLPPHTDHTCSKLCSESYRKVSAEWFVDQRLAPGNVFAEDHPSVPSVPAAPPDPSDPLGSTDYGCSEGKGKEGRRVRKAVGERCEVEGCSRPVTGAMDGHYVCAAHVDASNMTGAASAASGHANGSGEPAHRAALEAFQKAGFDVH